MFAHVLEVTKMILSSEAFAVELKKLASEFEGVSPIRIQDLHGHVTTLALTAPVDLPIYEYVAIGEPPVRSIKGPWPRAYIYHINSEYPTLEQEADIRSGNHRCGITLFGSAEKPEVAEQQTGRLALATQRLIERNQYIYGQLPAIMGTSTLTFMENMFSPAHASKGVVPIHLIFVAKIRETRI